MSFFRYTAPFLQEASTCNLLDINLFKTEIKIMLEIHESTKPVRSIPIIADLVQVEIVGRLVTIFFHVTREPGPPPSTVLIEKLQIGVYRPVSLKTLKSAMVWCSAEHFFQVKEYFVE